MILELTKQNILNLTNESKRKNNQPSREDDGHCTACMTGQRWKRNVKEISGISERSA